ncbi:MAG: ribonuclease HII [Defluviitaleaceae bacterium]|nr:ribonuclease HII [Defluviitaleaceae bacterium]
MTDCYETTYSQYNHIAGIDEVGRGPLAGPVVSAAVILPRECVLPVDDSKKLSDKKRRQLFIKIKEQALAIGIGIVDHKTIDEINILQATKLSMLQAIKNLAVEPDFLLVDALTLDTPLPQLAIVKGDEKNRSIAAASIIAKVTRDDMMIEYHQQYPQYLFDKNKGYGVAAHIAAIKMYGLCPIHRRSFTKGYGN